MHLLEIKTRKSKLDQNINIKPKFLKRESNSTGVVMKKSVSTDDGGMNRKDIKVI